MIQIKCFSHFKPKNAQNWLSYALKRQKMTKKCSFYAFKVKNSQKVLILSQKRTKKCSFIHLRSKLVKNWPLLGHLSPNCANSKSSVGPQWWESILLGILSHKTEGRLIVFSWKSENSLKTNVLEVGRDILAWSNGHRPAKIPDLPKEYTVTTRVEY